MNTNDPIFASRLVHRALLPGTGVLNVPDQAPVRFFSSCFTEHVDKNRKKLKRARIRPFGPPTKERAAHAARMRELAKKKEKRAKNKELKA